MSDIYYDLEEAVDLYDSNPNLTISDLARMTGLPRNVIKARLLDQTSNGSDE